MTSSVCLPCASYSRTLVEKKAIALHEMQEQCSKHQETGFFIIPDEWERHFANYHSEVRKDSSEAQYSRFYTHDCAVCGKLGADQPAHALNGNWVYLHRGCQNNFLGKL